MRALPIARTEEWDAKAWAVAQVRASHTPALLASFDGTLIVANGHADALTEDGGVAPALRQFLSDTGAADKSQVVRVGVKSGGQTLRFDLTLLPLPYGDVLVVGREMTTEANLVEALTASRELFRDLALCSSDFAFELDATGVFTWVSQDGVLGFSSAELHGTAVKEVFGDGEALSAFMSGEPIQAREIWCRAKSGTERCMSLTVVPVARGGGWCGTRGIARDITALRLHEREAERLKRRDDLINAVVAAMRAQIEPRRIMLAAADALLAATASERVTIRAVRKELCVSVGRASEGAEAGLIAALGYQGQTNGSVSLARDAGGMPYGEDEQHLLEAVVPHVGVALALADALSAVAPAREDDQTGLLDRLGFAKEARKRLGAIARAGRSGALLLVALDKAPESDDLLKQMAREVSSSVDVNELAARLNADVFALLIDERAHEAAIVRAQRLQAAIGGLAVNSTICVVPVEANAGEPLDALMSSADLAIDAARREGRSIVIADQRER